MARRAASVALVLAALGACTDVRDATGPAEDPSVPDRGDVRVDGGRRTATSETLGTINGENVKTSELCSVEAASLLDCTVMYLAGDALDLCEPASPTSTDSTLPARQLRCSLNPDVNGATIGWQLTRDVRGVVTVKVFRGTVETVTEVLRATSAPQDWSSVELCPGDYSGDEVNDLAVVYRDARVADRAVIEVVNLSRESIPTPLRRELAGVRTDSAATGCGLVVGLSADFGTQSLNIVGS